MIEFTYEYKGDPPTQVRLMSGAEASALRGQGYIEVSSLSNVLPGVVIPGKRILFDEILCDLCNGEIGPVDPCYWTMPDEGPWSAANGGRIKCHDCSKKYEIKDAIPGSVKFISYK